MKNWQPKWDKIVADAKKEGEEPGFRLPPE